MQPAVAARPKRVPVIDGIAPQLASRAEVVGGTPATTRGRRCASSRNSSGRPTRRSSPGRRKRGGRRSNARLGHAHGPSGAPPDETTGTEQSEPSRPGSPGLAAPGRARLACADEILRPRHGELQHRRAPDWRLAFEHFGREWPTGLTFALFETLAPIPAAPASRCGRRISSAARPDALDRARRDLASRVEKVRFAQFLLFRQGARLKPSACPSVRLIGDLPLSSPRTRATCGPTRAVPARRAGGAHGRASSPCAAPRLFSSPRPAAGAIPSMTGRASGAATLVQSTACAAWLVRSTRSASIISEDSLRRGTSGRGGGGLGRWVSARAPALQRRAERLWARCLSSPRTWGSST